MPKDSEIPIAILRELFEVDFSTGDLTWRERPRHHFRTARGQWQVNPRCAGKAAGVLNCDGAIRVDIVLVGVRYRLRAHRIVWALAHGAWPEAGIDHRDGIASNNGLENLRAATQAENMQNLKASRRGGAYPNGSGFCSRIRVAGENFYLGQFATEAEAQTAYLEAKARLHTFQPVPR